MVVQQAWRSWLPCTSVVRTEHNECRVVHLLGFQQAGDVANCCVKPVDHCKIFPTACIIYVIVTIVPQFWYLQRRVDGVGSPEEEKWDRRIMRLNGCEYTTVNTNHTTT